MRGALLLLVASVVCGCASNRRPPVESAGHQVHRSVRSATEASTPEDPIALAVRYNPVDQCECPDFEVFVYGGWTRAYIDGAEELLLRLRDGNPLEKSSVTAEPTSKRRAPNGVDYMQWLVR